jgi:hypothetical protein
MLPEPIFAHVADADSNGSLERFITVVQNNNLHLMKEWESTFPIKCMDNPDKPFW